MINPITYYGNGAEALQAQAKLRAPLTTDEIQKIQEQFDRIQNVAIATFLHGRSLEDLNQDEMHLYKRLSTAKLNVVQTDPDLTNQCMMEGNVPVTGAAYRPFYQRVDICPADVRAGPYQLAKTFAHELGHSIDGCSAFLPLAHVNPIDQWRVSENIKGVVLKYRQPGSFQGGTLIYGMDAKDIKEGIVGVDSQGLSNRKSHPFIGTLECLEKNPSYKQRNFKTPDRFNPQNRRFQSLPQVQQAWYSTRKDCDGTKNTIEDFADLFGQEVIANRMNAIKPKPLLEDLQTFSLLSPYLGEVCVSALIGEKNFKQQSNDSHSSDLIRLASWIGQPSISDSINCQNLPKHIRPCRLFQDVAEQPESSLDSSKPTKAESVK